MRLLLLSLLGCPAAETPTPEEPPAPQPTVQPTLEVSADAARPLPEGTASGGVHYTLSAPEAAHHLLEVHLAMETGGVEQITLFQPTWTPGSYLIREFSRNVEGVSAKGASGPLPVIKQAKNRWAVQTRGSAQIEVSWRVYCNEPTVRTCFVDPDKWVVSPASVLLAPAEEPDRPYTVSAKLPRGFQGPVMPLEKHGELFHTETFDALMDAPLVAGRDLEVRAFTVEDVPHELVVVDAGDTWDLDWAQGAAEDVVQASRLLFPELPYPHYQFQTVIHPGAGGGLEHKDATLVMSDRWRTREDKDRRGLMSLWLHEHLHAVNGKRLRPAPLGPFDYEHEVYTDSLWVVEGVTSYYDDLLLVRAGLEDVDDFLDGFGSRLGALQTTPGRSVQTLSQASFDAWIELYRKDEHTPNQAVGYYLRGAVVAWLLDIELRKASDGAVTLDTWMQEAARRYSGERGYTGQDLRALANELTGADHSDFFTRALDSTEELDLDGALAWMGLLRGPETPGAPEAWLGGTFESRGGRLVLTEVRRGTPAWDAGLSVGDELVFWGRWRVSSLSEHLSHHEPGDRVVVEVARNGERLTRELVLGEKPAADAWKLRLDPDAPADVVARRDAWLGQSTGPDAAEEEPPEAAPEH